MRYSINWKRINKEARSRGERKAVGRFPRSLLESKLNELLTAYAEESLLRGVRPDLPEIRWRFFKQWEFDYGTSMKNPNRKWKCPKEVLEPRLEIFWIIVYRVRALCMAVWGYDPEMENFDESPYHHNETGSKLSLIHI